MYDPTFHEKTLARHLTARDFQNDNRLFDPVFKADAISRAVSYGRGGFPAVTLQSHPLRGKRVYQLTDIAETLVLRHMNSNVRRITHVKQADRQVIVDCIRQLMREGLEFNVLKYDIEKFYESVDPYSVTDCLESDPAFSGQSVRTLVSFFNGASGLGVQGLPRGLSISATLSEYVLRYFDEKVSQNPRVRYYARFVDDMIIVTSTDETSSVIDQSGLRTLPQAARPQHEPA